MNGDFNYNDMARLGEILKTGEEEEERYQEENTPQGPHRQSDQIAKPFTKVEATINNRRIGDTASKKENVVWNPEEVKDLPVEKDEKRPRPDFEVIYKQAVGTEDVYLGMSNMDPSSTKCQALLIKVRLPETKLSEIQCDLNKDSILIQTPKFFLHHFLNHEVKDKDSKAKWVSDKEELHVEAPVVPYLPF